MVLAKFLRQTQTTSWPMILWLAAHELSAQQSMLAKVYMPM